MLPVGETLAFDAMRCPRQRLEPPRRDRPATPHTRAVRPRAHACEGLIDKPELVIGPVAERQVALLREDLAGRGGL
jgi:hypothetical protein